MNNTIFIRKLSSEIFQEIEYENIEKLKDMLKTLITDCEPDVLIQLLLNNNILNDYDIIDDSLLSKIKNYDFITIIFIQKKELYCLNNENGKYILDSTKTDDYSKLLKNIVCYYNDESYNIIKDNTYKDLVLFAVKAHGYLLEYIGIDLQGDKDVVMEAIKDIPHSLGYASYELQKNKEIGLECVKRNGYVLEYLCDDFKNDKDIVLEAIKEHGDVLEFASSELQKNKEIVLTAVKKDGWALLYASIDLQDDKEIVLAAIKENKIAIEYASIRLQHDKDILLEMNK